MAQAVTYSNDQHRPDHNHVSKNKHSPVFERSLKRPVKSWKDILWNLYENISKDRIGLIAAGTTFYLILALFPALASFVSLYGLLADPVTIQDHINNLGGVLPNAALDLVNDELKRLASAPKGTLSFAFVLSIAVALWSANNGVRALFDALNVAYDEEEKRGFFNLLFISFTFTFGGLVFGILLINAIIGIPLILSYFNLGRLGEILVTAFPVLLLFVMANLGITLFYRYGPSRTPAQWRWMTWGSTLAAFFWMLASALFSWYLSNFANYSATYGSLGTMIGVMTWIYLSMWIVLVGAEFNAQLEAQTDQNTNIQKNKPLGQHNADKADHVDAETG